MRRSSSISSAKVVSAAFNSSILRTACITVVWSRPPNLRPISGSERGVSCLHRYIATWRGRARAAGGMHIGEPDVVVLGDAFLNLVDGHTPVVGTQQIVQHLLGAFER